MGDREQKGGYGTKKTPQNPKPNKKKQTREKPGQTRTAKKLVWWVGENPGNKTGNKEGKPLRTIGIHLQIDERKKRPKQKKLGALILRFGCLVLRCRKSKGTTMAVSNGRGAQKGK